MKTVLGLIYDLLIRLLLKIRNLGLFNYIQARYLDSYTYKKGIVLNSFSHHHLFILRNECIKIMKSNDK